MAIATITPTLRDSVLAIPHALGLSQHHQSKTLMKMISQLGEG